MCSLFKSISIFFVGLFTLVFASPDKEAVCMIGHRGYSSKYADNTEQAFIAAAKHGSGGVETDVRFTKDGELVLSHNAEVEYADGTTLAVAESTFNELTAKPLKNNKNKDEVYLCSFKRYLEICREYNMICFIELKGEFNDDLIKAAFSLADEVYDLKKCSMQSFDMNNLIRTHELFPELQVMLTYGAGEKEKGVDYRQCFEYGFSIDAEYKIVDRDMVKEFHDRGLEIGVWTCNNIFALNYGYWLGVDYIESDIF